MAQVGTSLRSWVWKGVVSRLHIADGETETLEGKEFCPESQRQAEVRPASRASKNKSKSCGETFRKLGAETGHSTGRGRLREQRRRSLLPQAADANLTPALWATNGSYWHQPRLESNFPRE